MILFGIMLRFYWFVDQMLSVEKASLLIKMLTFLKINTKAEV